MSIHLAPISLAHAPEVQRLVADPRIAATSNVPDPYPPDGAATWIRHTTAQQMMGREMNFAIFDDGAPRGEDAGRGEPPRSLVGVCGVLNIGGTPLSGELGYWIGVPYWGRGFATAAARELLRIVFEGERLAHLRSSCLVRNQASFRVLEKVGFRLTGFGSHPSGKWTTQDRFAQFELTKEEWRRGKGIGGEGEGLSQGTAQP